jgi:hypothetical protein
VSAVFQKKVPILSYPIEKCAQNDAALRRQQIDALNHEIGIESASKSFYRRTV